MKVRKIKNEELENAKKIYEEAFQKNIENIKAKKNIYVLTDKNEILGICKIDYIQDPFTTQTVAYLNNICIKKEYQNKGLGTILLTKIEEICKKNNASKIMLTSNEKRIAANILYQKQNYQKNTTNIYIKELEWKIYTIKC